MDNVIVLHGDKETEVPSQTTNETSCDVYKSLIELEKKAIQDIRLLRIKKKKIQKQHQPIEKTITEHALFKKIHRELANNMMTILKSLGVSAVPEHQINPLAVREDGVPGDGSRQITYNLYFPSHDSTEAESVEFSADIPDDAVLVADEAIGYTTVELNFDDDDGNNHTIIGKTICSSNDHYNGNVGLLLAMQNAFDQIEARKIETPITTLAHLIQGFQDLSVLSILSESEKNIKNEI